MKIFFCVKNQPKWINLYVHKLSFVVHNLYEFHSNLLSCLFLPLFLSHSFAPPDIEYIDEELQLGDQGLGQDC
jgi:hypothetical protein